VGKSPGTPKVRGAFAPVRIRRTMARSVSRASAKAGIPVHTWSTGRDRPPSSESLPILGLGGLGMLPRLQDEFDRQLRVKVELHPFVQFLWGGVALVLWHGGIVVPLRQNGIHPLTQPVNYIVNCWDRAIVRGANC
jgi:hypothetical protein